VEVSAPQISECPNHYHLLLRIITIQSFDDDDDDDDDDADAEAVFFSEKNRTTIELVSTVDFNWSSRTLWSLRSSELQCYKQR